MANMALPDDPKNPRWSVYSVVAPKTNWSVEPSEPLTLVPFTTIEYRLERQDGGGTFIYRRITPLWKQEP